MSTFSWRGVISTDKVGLDQTESKGLRMTTDKIDPPTKFFKWESYLY